jgi:5-methyltetrahydrofolate--homocysteine methyltransferase
MRKRSAPAEQKLWYCLRDRRLNRLKFRRQVSIDQYVADFYCAESKVIIELDGESHIGQEQNDELRTTQLNRLGFRVIRFSNVDIFENLDGVLLSILRECENRKPSLGKVCTSADRPSPQPSPPITREREPESFDNDSGMLTINNQ